MTYYSQPRYWFVTRKFLDQHPNLFDLIWPRGFESEKEILGEFYHIPLTHPNAAWLQLALIDCPIKYISGRSEAYFPRYFDQAVLIPAVDDLEQLHNSNVQEL